MARAIDPARNGFTLVEMLVALIVFAMLAAAGVGLLRSSVDLQAAVDSKLSDARGFERLRGVFVADLGQAMARPEIGVGDLRRPSFEGTAERMRLIRGGWTNLDGQARSSLQAVEWYSETGGVARAGHVDLDGTGNEAPALLGKQITIAFRYRTADGRWLSSFSSTRRELLPAAVELTLTPRAGPNAVIVAALPPRGLEPEDPVTPPPAAPAS